MATKITDLTELSVTAASGDFLHIIDVGDPAGGSAGTSKKIKVSNLPGGGGGGAVSSVNGQTGVVSLGVQDLDDVFYCCQSPLLVGAVMCVFYPH